MEIRFSTRASMESPLMRHGCKGIVGLGFHSNGTPSFTRIQKVKGHLLAAGMFAYVQGCPYGDDRPCSTIPKFRDEIYQAERATGRAL